jgi:TatA/E family protein of Tat protein translocase
MGELVIILVIALIIFGPRKLPELGRSLGKSLGEFRKASNELKSTLEEEIRVEEHKEQRAKIEAERDTAVAAASSHTEVTASETTVDGQPPEEPTVNRTSSSSTGTA